MDYIEISAKTVDDAITDACQKFTVTSDKLEYEVVDEGKTGLLGIGARPAVIKVRVKSSVEDKAKDFLKDVFAAMDLTVVANISYNEEENAMDIELSGEMSIKSGKAKLVLILPDNTLILLAEKDFASNSNEITQTFSVKQGLNRIKLVAEKNTELDLVLASTDGDFQELGINW